MNLRDLKLVLNIFSYNNKELCSNLLFYLTIYSLPFDLFIIILLFIIDKDTFFLNKILVYGILFIFLVYIKRFVLFFLINKKVLKKLKIVEEGLINIKNDSVCKKKIEVNGIDEIDKILFYTNEIFDKYCNIINTEKQKNLIDHLTGALNRKALEMNFKSALERYHRENISFCLLLFDIDNFKKFNDTYGHNIGDVVLVELSKVIIRDIRKYDSFYRIGGEEFVILFENVKLDDIKKLSDRLRETITKDLRKILKKYNVKMDVTISGGLICRNNYDKDLELKYKNSTYLLKKLIRDADELLYEAKNLGKNKILSKK